jgi:regulator of nucleoside diphosphate kinase
MRGVLRDHAKTPTLRKQQMESRPPLIVSSLDLERLERLLESEPYRRLPGVDALREELGRATIVEPNEIPPGVVTMNSTARFIDDVTGERYELTLVYPEAAGGADRVSIMAPAGSALLGLSVGHSISWQVPGGRRLQLRVLEVVSQPEAEGKYYR